ncbi:MAG: hypothetical protein FWE30_07980 [Bacteroidales bacterium]|nr:hypothetical protein [Bacteroidales bacterium]MCL2739366.1 hypothetical protein [Bacteroidales bacterium]
MKHLCLCVAACLFLSCGQNSDEAKTAEAQTKVQEIAQTFLAAYLQLDFDGALLLCGQALHADLKLSAQRIYELSSDMQELLKKDLGAYSFNIVDIELNPSKDSASVSYFVFTPEIPDGVPTHLTVAKEEQGWKVVKLL